VAERDRLVETNARPPSCDEECNSPAAVSQSTVRGTWCPVPLDATLARSTRVKSNLGSSNVLFTTVFAARHERTRILSLRSNYCTCQTEFFSASLARARCSCCCSPLTSFAVNVCAYQHLIAGVPCMRYTWYQSRIPPRTYAHSHTIIAHKTTYSKIGGSRIAYSCDARAESATQKQQKASTVSFVIMLKCSENPAGVQ
jgi:hypothetical protein